MVDDLFEVNCTGCKFYKSILDSRMGLNHNNREEGLCARFPPIVNGRLSVHPLVDYRYSCGEFVSVVVA